MNKTKKEEIEIYINDKSYIVFCPCCGNSKFICINTKDDAKLYCRKCKNYFVMLSNREYQDLRDYNEELFFYIEELNNYFEELEKGNKLREIYIEKLRLQNQKLRKDIVNDKKFIQILSELKLINNKLRK